MPKISKPGQRLRKEEYTRRVRLDLTESVYGDLRAAAGKVGIPMSELARIAVGEKAEKILSKK